VKAEAQRVEGGMDEFPNSIAEASFDRVKPIAEKVDSCLGCSQASW
jgi:hypothetical protein